MPINFATGGDQDFPSRLYDSYWTPLYTQFSTSSSAIIKTFDNHTMPSTASDVYHVMIAHIAHGTSQFGGAIKLQYSNNNGSSYSNFSTADMGTVDSQSGFDSVSQIGGHINFASSGSFIKSDTFVWYYAPQSSQSKFRIQIGADSGSGGSPNITVNRRGSESNQYMSFSYFEEKIYFGVNS